MSRTTNFHAATVQRAREQVGGAQSAREIRAGLSVILPALCNVPNRVVADVLSVGIATVSRMQKEIRDQAAGKACEKGNWGGRRRATMSCEKEKAFLDRWTEQAESGGILVVPPIHAAVEEEVGHAVAKSTVYRMLARHGWRKVEPDTCHPQRDAEAQEEFKKGASRKVWQRPCEAMTRDFPSG
jgi:transposase